MSGRAILAAGAMLATAIASAAAPDIDDAASAPEAPTIVHRPAAARSDARIDFSGGREARRVPGIIADDPAAMRAPARADAAAVLEGRDTEGMVRLALDYWRGANGPRNVQESRRLFEAAASRGDVRARIAVAWMLAEGLGAPRDTPRGRELLDALARQGHGRAGYLRFLVDESHPDGREPGDRRLARLQEAAALGDGLAQNHLGIEFEKLGQSGTARLWYAEGTRAGSRAAHDNLERMDAKVARRRAKAALPALLAEAERGNREATFEVAQRYHRGDGVTVNYAEAVRWYQVAASREHAGARRMLALIHADPESARSGFDSVWMKRLAQVNVGADGGTPRLESVADGLPVRDPDPLAGLELTRR